jgi:glycosyltransferase involved in cell wall biosynthesis
VINPLITIGITTYNAEESIERCILSALAQRWKPIEIVVVDDCSDDHTLDIINRVSANSTNIKLFRNAKNNGVAYARNRIQKEANGEFLVFFDDDDESLPNRIFEQYKRITEYEKYFANGAPVICHTNRRVIYPNNQERIESTLGLKLEKQAPSGLAVAERILLGSPLEDGYGSCPTCCQMARLSTYRQLGGFDPSLRRGEDTDFNIRLAMNGGHFVGVDKPLVEQTMTKSNEKSLFYEYYYWRKILEKHRLIMESKGKFDFSISWLDLKQAWLERKRLLFLLNFFKLLIKNPILTLQRFFFALPNIGLNNQFSRFHSNKPK